MQQFKGLMTGRGQSQPCTQSGRNILFFSIVTGLRKTDKLNCVPFDFLSCQYDQLYYQKSQTGNCRI